MSWIFFGKRRVAREGEDGEGGGEDGGGGWCGGDGDEVRGRMVGEWEMTE